MSKKPKIIMGTHQIEFPCAGCSFGVAGRFQPPISFQSCSVNLIVASRVEFCDSKLPFEIGRTVMQVAGKRCFDGFVNIERHHKNQDIGDGHDKDDALLKMVWAMSLLSPPHEHLEKYFAF